MNWFFFQACIISLCCKLEIAFKDDQIFVKYSEIFLKYKEIIHFIFLGIRCIPWNFYSLQTWSVRLYCKKKVAFKVQRGPNICKNEWHFFSLSVKIYLHLVLLFLHFLDIHMCKKICSCSKDTLDNFDFHVIRLLKIQIKLKTLFEIRPPVTFISNIRRLKFRKILENSWSELLNHHN